VAFAPDGHHAYVSGTPKGSSPVGGPTQGDQGDVIHIFAVDPTTGVGVERTPLTLPATTGGSARMNSLPPVSGVGTAQPEGIAVSPDGRYLVVALNGADSAVVVNLSTLAQTVLGVGAYPDGVAFDPQGRAYVSNEYDGTLSVIDPQAARVTATIGGLGGTLGDLNSHPEGMVADPRRARLYVAVTNRDLVAVVDTTRHSVTGLVSVARSQGLGTAPTNLAISPDDSTLYASDSGEDAVAAISLSSRSSAGSSGAGGTGNGTRRSGGAANGHRVYLPPSVKSIGTYRARRARAALRLARVHGGAQAGARRRFARTVRTLTHRYLRTRTSRACAGPSRHQEQVYVSRVLHALAAPRSRRSSLLRRARHGLPKAKRCAGRGGGSGGAGAGGGNGNGQLPGLAAFQVIGRIPTAAYPDSVQTTPQGQLVWVAGKGFGSGPNPSYYFGGATTPYQTPPSAYGTYVLDLLIGRVGTLALPTDRQVLADTPAADAQSQPSNSASQPAGSPIPAATGHPSPQIKHVFYIVRENRTYDQVFGADPRGNGNANLQLFNDNGVSGPTGGITPNAHALTRRFPLLDHFYADSEVSVDGHLITAGSYATDYVQKATAANYSNRRGTFDFGIYPVTAPRPSTCSIKRPSRGSASATMARRWGPRRPPRRPIDRSSPRSSRMSTPPIPTTCSSAACRPTTGPAAPRIRASTTGPGRRSPVRAGSTSGTRSSRPRSRPGRSRSSTT